MSGIFDVISIFISKGKKNMFDEEGRKIDLGLHIGMNLKQMSVAELENYIEELHKEINRVQNEMESKKSSTAAADALFK
jgi:uncharacterized small protein (DUF1192 family)